MQAPFLEPKFNLADYDESKGKEMNLEKFAAICKENRKYFFNGKIKPAIPLILITREQAAQNPYLNCIKEIVTKEPLPGEYSGWSPETGSKDGWEETIVTIKRDITEFSYEALRLKKKMQRDGMLSPLTYFSNENEARYCRACEIAYWHLLALKYDETNDPELQKTADVINQIGFTAKMTEDWRAAAEYTFNGNVFDEDCNLKFVSEEAKIFFLHIYG